MYVTLIGITGILLLLFIGNQVIHYLRVAAEGKIATSLLVHIILLQMPYFVGLLLPMGLFFGVLLSLARMYVDNEMVVLFASGFGRRQLYGFVMANVGVVILISAVLTLWFNPLIAVKRDYYSSGRATNSIFDMILPGRFQSAMGNNLVFYVQNMAGNHQKVKNFFMAERPQRGSHRENGLGRGWSVVSAEGAEQKVMPNGDHYIVATNGHRYQGVPGKKDYALLKFQKYGVKLPGVPSSIASSDVQTKSTVSLFLTSRYSHKDMAELQWRFSIPIGGFLLALLAIPLSRVNPRQGRYAQLLPGVLICLFYLNMLFVARAWVGNGALNPWIGMWSVHLVMLVLTLGWIMISAKWKEL